MPSTEIELRRAKVRDIAIQIDNIAAVAAPIFEAASGFADELAVAQAFVDMRALLTDEVMTPVMSLMNTDLGFRTDRDPKTSKEPVTAYPVATVRECFIEAKLRGLHLCGNEWNIISGRTYVAQAGFKRKVREATGGTFEPSYDVPVISPDGKSARVKCRGRWQLNGQQFTIGIGAEDPCEFSIRVNAYMGADAVVGKAERKLHKRVYERITGREVPESTLDDAPPIKEAKAQPTPNLEPTLPDGQPQVKADTDPQPTVAPSGSETKPRRGRPRQPETPPPAAATVGGGPIQRPAELPQNPTVADIQRAGETKLAECRRRLAEAGVPEGFFVSKCNESGVFPEVGTLEEVHEDTLELVLRERVWASLVKSLKLAMAPANP